MASPEPLAVVGRRRTRPTAASWQGAFRRVVGRFGVSVLFLWIAVGLGACSDTERTPEATALRFLSEMTRVSSSADARERAFELLDEASQARLARLSRQADALGRAELAPWDMLSFYPGDPSFEVSHARFSEDDLLVFSRSGESSSIQMVRQGENWRVHLLFESSPPGWVGESP